MIGYDGGRGRMVLAYKGQCMRFIPLVLKASGARPVDRQTWRSITLKRGPRSGFLRPLISIVSINPSIHQSLLLPPLASPTSVLQYIILLWALSLHLVSLGLWSMNKFPASLSPWIDERHYHDILCSRIVARNIWEDPHWISEKIGEDDCIEQWRTYLEKWTARSKTTSLWFTPKSTKFITWFNKLWSNCRYS